MWIYAQLKWFIWSSYSDVVIPKSMVLVEELSRRRPQDKKDSSDTSEEDTSDDVFYDTEDDPEDDQDDDVSESVT